MIQLLLLTLLSTPISDKGKIIYVGDPMCSWCYGIAPEMELLKESYGEKLEFELVLGGLRPYNTQTMLDLKDFLIHHWHEVNQRSGQEFTYGILDESEITYDTEPPCRATMIVRDLEPEHVFAFFHATQDAFYKENKNMHKLDSYEAILDVLQIDKQAFNDAFVSADSKEKIKQDFKRAELLGVNSFPTVLFEYQGQTHMIAKGFSTNEKMSKRINDIINK